jgi:hypothetical protein
MISLGVTLCGKSIATIPNLENAGTYALSPQAENKKNNFSSFLGFGLG